MVRFAAENPRFIKICFSWKSEFYENPSFMKIQFLRKSVFLKIQFWQSCFLKYRVFRKSKFSRKFRKSLIFWKLGLSKNSKIRKWKIIGIDLNFTGWPGFQGCLNLGCLEWNACKHILKMILYYIWIRRTRRNQRIFHSRRTDFGIEKIFYINR